MSSLLPTLKRWGIREEDFYDIPYCMRLGCRIECEGKSPCSINADKTDICRDCVNAHYIGANNEKIYCDAFNKIVENTTGCAKKIKQTTIADNPKSSDSEGDGQ